MKSYQNLLMSGFTEKDSLAMTVKLYCEAGELSKEVVCEFMNEALKHDTDSLIEMLKESNQTEGIKPSEIYYGFPVSYMIRVNDVWSDKEVDQYTSIGEIFELKKWCDKKIFKGFSNAKSK